MDSTVPRFGRDGDSQRHHLRVGSAAVLLCAACVLLVLPTHCSAADATQSATRPNIVLILADDMEWQPVATSPDLRGFL